MDMELAKQTNSLGVRPMKTGESRELGKNEKQPHTAPP